MLQSLHARGSRVRVATVVADDIAPYRAAVRASAQRLSQWNPVDPEDLERHLRAQSSAHRTFIIRARDAEGSHGIVGKVNVSNVVRGRFQNGTMGYDAYDPYAGRGLFAEGLSLVVGIALTPEPHGMGLHRVEANVQPGNVTSAGVLRKLGFRREGHIPRMLWLTDSTGRTDWRHHDAYAVTADEWPAAAYAPHRPSQVVVVVTGEPGEARTSLARRLSLELSIPLYRAELLADPRSAWRAVAESPVGGVIESSPVQPGQPAESLRSEAEIGSNAILQVVCGDADSQTGESGIVHVDTSGPVADRTVAALALQARAVALS